MTEKEIKRKNRIMKTLKRAVNSNCLKESPFTTNETITKYSAMLFNKETWENAGKLYITVDNFGIRFETGGASAYFGYHDMGDDTLMDFWQDSDGYYRLSLESKPGDAFTRYIVTYTFGKLL